MKRELLIIGLLFSALLIWSAQGQSGSLPMPEVFNRTALYIPADLKYMSASPVVYNDVLVEFSGKTVLIANGFSSEIPPHVTDPKTLTIQRPERKWAIPDSPTQITATSDGKQWKALWQPTP